MYVIIPVFQLRNTSILHTMFSTTCFVFSVSQNTAHLKQGAFVSPSLTDLKDNMNIGGSSTKRVPWSAIVNVVLVEGKDLKVMDLEGTSDPYCKVR